MADVNDILADVPATTGSVASAAQALGQPIHEGMLGDPSLNGEHVVAHTGLRDLLDGKLSDTIVRAADKADDPSMAGVAGLGAVEDAVNKHADSLDSHVKNIFGDRDSKPEIDAPIDADSHRELVERIQSLANNPSSLIDELSNATQALHAVAPQTAQSAQETAARAVQFLASKSAQPDPDPLGDPYEPSATERMDFDRYLKVIEEPALALRQVKDGSLTPETTETLANVYPRLFDRMKQSVIEKLDPSMPYQTKMAVSQFLGEPLDSSLSPQRIANLQSTFGTAPQPPAPAGAKPARKSTAKIDLADRTSLEPKDTD